MTKKEFQTHLVKLGLITLQPGAPSEGQHVFHIIAVANGGPDHVSEVRSCPAAPQTSRLTFPLRAL